MKNNIKKILENKNVKLYGIYTLLFFICSIAIFYPFVKLNHSFIWETDGFAQHFAILYNFNESIRSWICNIGQGIDTFSWSIGLGSDAIGEFSYYVLGDPFAYISLLFPMNKLEFAYSFLIFLRMYCIGISFLLYCKTHNKKIFNSIIGALLYTFCAYVLFAGVRHPYFSNPLIMLPIVFIGIDKILKENKGLLFAISIAITAIMNYYFLYMITILAIIYAVIKYIVEVEDKNLKDAFRKIGKAAISYILGVFVSAVILFPTIYAFLNSNRITDTPLPFLYPISYYKRLFAGLIIDQGNYWSRICMSPIVILLVPVCLYRVKHFKENKNVENKAILINIIIDFIMLLFAFCGSMMNGFSFQQNRWVFGFVFLLAYMVVLNIDRKLKFSDRECDLMVVILFLYYSVIGIFELVPLSHLITTFGISIAFIVLAYISNSKLGKRIKKYIPYLTTIIILLSIFNYANQLYNVDGYAEEFEENNKAIELYNEYEGDIKNFGQAIDELNGEDKNFYRISDTNNNTSVNMSLVHNYKPINEYFSIGNKYIGELCKSLIIRNYKATNPLQKLDSRTKISSLLGTKYYITTKKEKNRIPYGYKLYKELSEEGGNKKTLIYENKNTVSLGIFYDKYITSKDYNKLNVLEKEQALLDNVVIDKEVNIKYNKQYIKETQAKTTKNCTYKVTDQDANVIVQDKSITTMEKDQKIKLHISQEVNSSELYLYIDGLKFEPKGKSSKYSITAKYGNITKKQNVEDKNKSAYYVEMPGILINLGYKEKHTGDVEVTFSSIGTYEYKSMKLISVPMDVYKKSIKRIKENEFELTQYSNRYIEGKISNKKNGILQLSIPYTKGWKAYVDGVKVETINVNMAFIGIPLEAGEHKVHLEYETPCLKLGIITTCTAIVMLIIYAVLEKKYREGENIVKENISTDK